MKVVSMYSSPISSVRGMMRRLMRRAEGKATEASTCSRVRSLLFLPASQPAGDRQGAGSGADLVVLDLEDAVKPEDKDAARDAAVEAVADDWPMPVAIRVNGVGTRMAFARPRRGRAIEAPISWSCRARSRRISCTASREAVGKPVLAMIETAAGVLAAAEIAQEAAALIAGTNDLRADLRLPLDAAREPISAVAAVDRACRARGRHRGVRRRVQRARRSRWLRSRKRRRGGGSASTARA